MQSDELMSLKETGQKGDFLLPYEVSKTIMPDYYTTFPMHWHDEMEIVFVEQGEYIESVDFEEYHVKSGDIVLFHNDARYILDALPTILKSYREQGFTVVPISALLLPGETTIDAQGIQRPAPTTIPEV